MTTRGRNVLLPTALGLAALLGAGCQSSRPARPTTGGTNAERGGHSGKRGKGNASNGRKGSAQRAGNGRKRKREGGGKEGRVVVSVSGLRNDKGRVLIALYRGPKGFPSDRNSVVRSAHVPIAGGHARAVIDDVPAGSVAVAVLHDENGNGKMDRRLGIPKEGYGISRNPPRHAFRAPHYAEARMKVRSGTTLRVPIRMRYIGGG